MRSGVATVTDRLHALEERLPVLEAVEAVKQLKYRYWRACDDKDPVVFRECFVDDAKLDYGALGSFDSPEPILQAFVAIALEVADGTYVIRDSHHGYQPTIDISGATSASPTATGLWAFRIRQVNLRDGTESVSAGEYRDEYVVRDGEWKIKSSAFRSIWSIRRPFGEETIVAGEMPPAGDK